ncbi:MAG TPA: uracil-DNA glycosylase [Candidatus Dormibacteraeota bacterium]|nr:uracil-DNA glycosylase [Candidatus Dormibacteraeota bacterium]
MKRGATERDPGLVPVTDAADGLAALEREVVGCRRCPRLVEWREQTARVKRSAFASESYWGRPLPGFGDPAARLLVLGLAPAAHGGNRTGRIFTGDRSGDWLFASLWRTGFANQAESRSRDDGLRLQDCYIAASVRCAPPANRPLPVERDNCLPYLMRELELLAAVRAVVCLGSFAWDVALRALRAHGTTLPRPMPRFGHGTTAPVGRYALLGCYHPSQQNTFTGRLTEPMLDAVMLRARELAGLE